MYDVVSLFSGCGGLDLGFKKAGFNIIWANDFDKYAVESYKHNIDKNIILGDINEISAKSIPKHDILIGGFPCQPFSMMGQELGFSDHRGTLFFKIIDILKFHIENYNSPKVIVLENVKNLQTHDKGKTFKVIKNELEKLGYLLNVTTLNSSDYGVPQTRNRTYIVGIKDLKGEFKFPTKINSNVTLQDLLEHNVNKKYFLSDKILKTVMATGTKGYHAKPEIDLKIARPLCATMAKMHRASQDNYVTENGNIRRLTPRECARLQGFPNSYEIIVSDSQAYKQFGNAVTVNVSYQVALKVLEFLNNVGEV